MPRSQTDILIVGAGAAGLTLAIDLARRGVSFRLVDKAEHSFEGSRGKGIQPRSQEVFEDLGVLGDMLALGAAPYPMIRSYSDAGFTDQAMSEAMAPTPAEPYAAPLMLPQMLTERALRTRLAELGHAPRYASELVGFEDGSSGVTAQLRTADGDEVVEARWLIGADGGRSFVRRALGVDFPGQTLPVRALVADLELGGLSRRYWHRWMASSEGQLSLCPLAGTDLFQLQAALPLDREADTSNAGISAMIARRTGRGDLVVGQIAWRSAYGMSARLADRYRVGHVLLAGDAAHVHPPTGGQGLNTSVQDAYNLGWKLAAVLGGADEGLIDTYEEERRPVAAEVLGLSRSLLTAAQTTAGMRRGREAHELDLTYAGASLALDLMEAPGRVIAGDRAPDAPLATGRLFDLFAGPHWTLIGWQVGDAQVAPRPGLTIRTDLVDPGGHFGEAYVLAAGTWLLVRPDGYVGAVVPAGQEAAIEGYLDRITSPSPVAA
jgi:2-polyprenyl-6-methoxyphenol hydroxylase-like FAD-dependent oxidoreductase